MVELADCRDMRGCAGKENLFCQVQLRAVDVPLDDVHSEFFPGQTDDRVARYTQQAVVRFRRSDDDAGALIQAMPAPVFQHLLQG